MPPERRGRPASGIADQADNERHHRGHHMAVAGERRGTGFDTESNGRENEVAA